MKHTHMRTRTPAHSLTSIMITCPTTSERSNDNEPRSFRGHKLDLFCHRVHLSSKFSSGSTSMSVIILSSQNCIQTATSRPISNARGDDHNRASSKHSRKTYQNKRIRTNKKAMPGKPVIHPRQLGRHDPVDPAWVRKEGWRQTRPGAPEGFHPFGP